MRPAWYWPLFAVESAAVLFVLCCVAPLYYELLAHSGTYQPGAGVRLPVFCCVVVMQLCYWVRLKRCPTPRVGFGTPLFGHVLMFLARLSFVFVASAFALVFLNRMNDTIFSAVGLAVFVALLFAMFCYSIELERMGRGMLELRG